MGDSASRDDQGSMQSTRQKRDYQVVVHRGLESVSAAFDSLSDAVPLTPFQSRDWILCSYQVLAPANAAEPCLVIVRRQGDGALCFALPLVIAQERGLTLAGFPDFGLADYGAPLVCGGAIKDLFARDIATVWNQVCHALSGLDRLSLTNMPETMAGRANPLCQLSRAVPASHARYVVKLETSVEDFLISRGKKYRKEVERCYRLLAQRGDWRFVEAKTDDDITQAFDDLDRLQGQRWHGASDDYHLQTTAVADFYRRNLTLAQSTDHGAKIFTLKSEGETIAVLYGLVFENTFTLLRIASAGGELRRLSPGRLIVMETMRHFLQHQIKTFDLGIGDYAFKRGLGAQQRALVDVEQALTLRAYPHVMLMQAKGWLRRYPALVRLAKAARQKMSLGHGQSIA